MPVKKPNLCKRCQQPIENSRLTRYHSACRKAQERDTRAAASENPAHVATIVARGSQALPPEELDRRLTLYALRAIFRLRLFG